MLSKLLKGQEADQANHFSFPGVGEKSAGGIRPFELKQVGPAYANDSAGFKGGKEAEPGAPGERSDSAAEDANSQPSKSTRVFGPKSCRSIISLSLLTL